MNNQFKRTNNDGGVGIGGGDISDISGGKDRLRGRIGASFYQD